MAEEQEEIIIIEESDALGAASASTSNDNSDESSRANKKRKVIFISALASLLLLAGGGAGWFFLTSGDNTDAVSAIEKTQNEFSKNEEIIEPSALETMIERANFLYSNGNQTEALQLYEKIALYSEAISQYNLGVVQLKEGDFSAALENFKRSIDNSKNRCVSAINAAVCCLHLKREQEFHHYIQLAQEYLPQEVNSPMYSYYYALINYYQENYLEALSALKHPTTDEYLPIQNKMRAKISAMQGSYSEAIHALENTFQEQDSFSLGLLYANTGELDLAKKYLSDAIIQNNKPIQEQLALAFVSIKSGLYDDAAKLLKNTEESYPSDIYRPYPIQVHLKSDLFTPEQAQSLYRGNQQNNHYAIYQTIFYFAPYKIFNADQTISYINKGAANIYIDDINSAKEYLDKSTRASAVDYGIAKSIKSALKYRLRSANKQLNELLKSNPQHSILHYNLGLTYAQLGNISKANDHFLRSYHLDANNYLSGIFAIISSEMLGKERDKIVSMLQDNLARKGDSEEIKLYRTLLDITRNNFSNAAKWLDTPHKERPFNLALDVMIANEIGNNELAKKKASKLISLQPYDLLPHMMMISIAYQNQPTKMFASSAHKYLKKQTFHYDDFCFGPQITRDKTVLMAMMTGQLTPLIQRLEMKLQTSPEDKIEILNGLAQSYFYQQDFEKAYTLYNQLIDTHKIRDEFTFFMGGAASVGAEHYQSALALFQLSKINNPNFQESRYILALLQMQRENFPAAVTEFNHLGNSGFRSRYFDFSIDTDKLANEPAKYHPL